MQMSTPEENEEAVLHAAERIARMALGARGGLDFDVEQMAVTQAVAGDGLQRGQSLAGVGARVPAAGVELRQCAPRVIATGAAA